MRKRVWPSIAASAAVVLLISSVPAGQDASREVRDYLARHHVADAEIARLESGAVVTALSGAENGSAEVAVVAAVKIAVPRAQVASYYGQVIAYVDGEVTLAFGKFGSPPRLEDVRDLTFDREDVDELRSCRPGRCGVRVGGAGLETLRSAIDWTAADRADQVNAYARKTAVAYVAAYQSSGDAALVTYNDRAQPVALKDEWRGILGNSALFHEYAPELRAYLEQFPNGSLPGGRDVFYWIKERYGGLKPVVSIVHGVVYEPPARKDRTFIVQKQLYASHYIDASLAIATLLDTQHGGRPATYLVYANRTRGDMLKGGFGGLKRNVARTQARRAAEETLGSIKQMLEAAATP
jgi:hypothetical protein